MKKFDLRQSTETIDIAGEQFEIDVTQSKVKETVLKGHKLQEQADKLADMPEDASIEEQEQAIDDVEALLKDTTDFVLGEGAFDRIYPKTNESFLVMADVLYQVIDYIYDKQQEEAEKKKAKYVKKKKR